MSFFKNLKEQAPSGIMIGIGASILAPVILPILASVARPLAKAAVKGGFLIFEKGKEVVAETGEFIEDLVAEARSELTEENPATFAAAMPAAGMAAYEQEEPPPLEEDFEAAVPAEPPAETAPHPEESPPSPEEGSGA